MDDGRRCPLAAVPHQHLTTTQVIETRYQDVTFGDVGYDAGASATVGIQAGSSGPALPFSCNRGSLQDGLSLSFTPL